MTVGFLQKLFSSNRPTTLLRSNWYSFNSILCTFSAKLHEHFRCQASNCTVLLFPFSINKPMLHNQRLLVVCAMPMDGRILSYLIGRLPQRSVLLVICLRDSFHFLLHQHLPFGSHNCSTFMEACTALYPKAVKALAMVCNGTCESSNAVAPSHLTSIVQ